MEKKQKSIVSSIMIEDIHIDIAFRFSMCLVCYQKCIGGWIFWYAFVQ